MFVMKQLVSAPRMALVLSLSTTPAFADVTAEQVWQAWQDIGGQMGYAFETGDITRDGATMTLTDLVFASTDDTVEITGTIPQVVMVEQGDGTVVIDIADEYAVTVKAQETAGQASTARMIITLAKDVLTASGTPEAMNYKFLAENIGFQFRDLTENGKPIDVTFEGRAAPVDFSYDFTTTEENAKLDIAVALGALSLSGRGTPPEDDDVKSFEFSASMTGLTGLTHYVLPAKDLGADPNPVLFFQEGGVVDSTLGYDSGEIGLTFVAPDDIPASVAGSAKNGRFQIAIGYDHLKYLLTKQDVVASVTGLRLPELGGMPLPELKATYEEVGIDWQVPLTPNGEEGQDFTAKTWQKGLVLSDAIWGMFDPLKQLPRDPMTVNLDLTGKMRPLMPILSEESFNSPTPPFEFDEITLNTLQVTAAGAELLGDGHLTFDNTQAKVLGDVLPMPLGKIDLSLVGANTLLGKLLEMGFADPEMVSGFAMMSTIFARPGETPDSLISNIEWKANGMYANGTLIPTGP